MDVNELRRRSWNWGSRRYS